MADRALAEKMPSSPLEAADNTEKTASATSDLADLLDKYTPAASGGEKDVAAGRYRIDAAAPLPELSRPPYQAFSATDLQGEKDPIYAIVTPNDLPFRRKAIAAFQKISHPALSTCYAAEPVDLSHIGERRLVFILQRPRGSRLSDIVRSQGRLSEKVVQNNILGPLCDAVAKLHQQHVNHGCINPDTIYFDQTVMLQECLSEPSGYSQQPAFEAPERLPSVPYGKGSGNLSADLYALGVLTIYLCRGGLPKAVQVSPAQLNEILLQNGCYNTLAKELELSENLMDILRGTLNDDPLERWSTEQLKSCIGGKRYNLIPPSIPKDSTRAFTYRDQNYFNQRAVSNALANSWTEAKTELDVAALVRWLELSTHDTDISGAIENILHSSLDRSSVPIKDIELSKAIAVMDPMGPMRLNELTVNIDGMGTTLAESFRQNDNRTKQLIMQIIETNLAGVYSGFHEKAHNYEIADTLWQLQNTKIMLSNNGLGLGIERVLYHINPSLPCQAKFLQPHHVNDVKSALETLDRIAAGHFKQHSLVDKHLAAFLAAKLEMTKVMRVVELGAFPDFANDNRLIMLKLLAQAQQKIGNPPLKGLAVWATEMIWPIIDKLHRKSTRETLMKEIRKAAKSGILEQVAFIMFKAQIIGEDLNEYQRARNLCKFHKSKVQYFTDKQKLRIVAREIGRQVSVTIAYVVLALTIYLVTKTYTHF